MSGEGPCQGGFLGCPDHTGWGGGMLSACRQGCMSVLSLRLSPLQPFNFSAMASGENWGGGADGISWGEQAATRAMLAAC